PTGVKGPVYDVESATGAILIGCSSAGTNGLIVLPGVIDADYTGEIQVAAYTLTPPLIIQKGTRIAELIIYSRLQLGSENCRQQPLRNEKGFGSTRDTIVSLVQQMQQRPMITLQLSNQALTTQVQAMMDTGADVTII
ncbi:POK9 protein, partial [Cephalopterus ornatus]|nr:POK9 protein [Cephalopterus ornatus]